MSSTGTEYFRNVLSPWVPGVDNPIPLHVDHAAAPEGLAIDVGCGPGVLTCYLAQRFKRVIAIDRDPEMVDATSELIDVLQAKGATLGEIEVRHQDWAECSDLDDSADLVCAINSMLEPEPDRRKQMLRGLTKAMIPGKGKLLAVFPAMEAQLHLVRLFAAALRGRGYDEAEAAAWLSKELVEAHSFDALVGTFASRNEPAQKFCYELELLWELTDAGFEATKTSKIIYPWEVCAQVDAGYFPDATELFDWFVRAKRP